MAAQLQAVLSNRNLSHLQFGQHLDPVIVTNLHRESLVPLRTDVKIK